MENSVGSPASKTSNRGADKKNLLQILREADPDAPKEEIEKFHKYVVELLQYMNIENDPMYQIVESLRKIESQMLYFSEARNLMVDRQARLPIHKKMQEEDIEAYENKQDKLRKDQRMAQQKKEHEQRQEENKEKQRDKAQKMIEYSVF